MSWRKKMRIFRCMCFARVGFAQGFWNPPETVPDTLQNPETETPPRQDTIGGSRNVRAEMGAGMSPADVAEHVYNAIQTGTFYIHTHPEHKAWVRNVWSVFWNSFCPKI